MKATREDVFRVIKGELDYQDMEAVKKSSPFNPDNNKHSIGEYLIGIDQYVKRAMKIVAEEPLQSGALPCIRGIAALTVACMEENGYWAR